MDSVGIEKKMKKDIEEKQRWGMEGVEKMKGLGNIEQAFFVATSEGMSLLMDSIRSVIREEMTGIQSHIESGFVRAAHGMGMAMRSILTVEEQNEEYNSNIPEIKNERAEVHLESQKTSERVKEYIDSLKKSQEGNQEGSIMDSWMQDSPSVVFPTRMEKSQIESFQEPLIREKEIFTEEKEETKARPLIDPLRQYPGFVGFNKPYFIGKQIAWKHSGVSPEQIVFDILDHLVQHKHEIEDEKALKKVIGTGLFAGAVKFGVGKNWKEVCERYWLTRE